MQIFKSMLKWSSFGIAGYCGYQVGKFRFQSLQYSSLLEIQLNTFSQDYLKRVRLQENRPIYNFFRQQLRLLQLMIIFFPVIISFPLYYMKKDLWLNLLVRTLEYAGPLWIKLGQWASHRSDIFGEEVVNKLAQLRDHSEAHNFKDTLKIYKDEFKVDLEKEIQIESKEPLASGSIGQVYRGKYKNQDVAIKVRHPNVLTHLRSDLEILYNVSNVICYIPFLKNLAMPVTFEEFSQTLMNQVDFRFEAQNLDILNDNFKKTPEVVFPRVIRSSESVLIETFEEGVHLQKFDDQQGKKIIANLGLKAFYKMLMLDNFIHADLHAGNMLIRTEVVNESKFAQIPDYIFQQVQKLMSYIPSFSSSNSNYDLLEQEQRKDEQQYWEDVYNSRKNNKKYKLILIDPGMVTILTYNDRVQFIKLIMYVALKQPKNCSELMLSLTRPEYKITEEQRVNFQKDIEDIFTKLCSVPIYKMDLGLIFKGMLDILNRNKLNIEGHFATLLTNMMILESIGRNLDPNLNIVSKASPFINMASKLDDGISNLLNYRFA